METTQSTSLEINCFKHPSEKIQRVNPNINSKSHVFCLECLLEEDQQQPSQDLLSISEFLTIADDFCRNNKQKAATELKAPPEYISAFGEQSKALEGLKEHLLQEKYKIGQLFDEIKEKFIESLEAQRAECLAELDQQLSRLQYWHVFFEKRLRMTYPETTTQFNQALSAGSLIKAIETITDPLQFEAYIRSIKEDLNEEILQLNKTKPFDQDKKFKLPSLYKRLLELQSFKPTYNLVTHKRTRNYQQELINLKKELQTQVKDLLDMILTFNHSIPDVLDDCSCPDSKVIEPDHYALLREWLPEEHRHQNLKLLYRGSRDGMSSIVFHENCDYKGPTLTLINCTFYTSSKRSIIGGYLDKDWHAEEEFIKSDKVFLFSLTAKVKCPISTSTSEDFAAYGKISLGPSFGQGYELSLNDNFRNNYIFPEEYENSDLLIDRKNQQPLLEFEDQKSYGMNHFGVHEIEVYTFK